jgi:replicative DNA helicase
MEKVKLNLTTTQENKLPSNIEAEQSLIGSVLVNNDIIDEISNIVSSGKFFDPVHRKIYEVIVNLNNKGMIANPITLKNYFENDSGLSEVGGVDYLVKLTRFSSSIKQAIDYAKIIHEMYVKRELIFISDGISDQAKDDQAEKTGENIIENAEKSLFDLAERGNFSQTFLKFNQALDQTIEMATLAMKSDQGIVGVPTGLKDLDEKLGGLHKSDLVIIAGRPSMGKTALATNIAYYAAKNMQENNEKGSVAFFSLH